MAKLSIVTDFTGSLDMSTGRERRGCLGSKELEHPPSWMPPIRCSGVGKTSVAYELHSELTAKDLAHCLIEGDNLDMTHPAAKLP
ncbi:hypothetical protein QFZ33_000886 [Arthrobacter globiformis]|nr:hypothetical protein [Arthrobacter globiformis]